MRFGEMFMKYMQKGISMTNNDYKELLYKIGPLRRDLISDGYDEALNEIRALFGQVKILSFNSGETCWTWKVPQKWTLKKAFIMSETKEILFDMTSSALFVTSYSCSVSKWVDKSELVKHIHSHNDAKKIPYSYAFYKNDWGFNLSKEQIGTLQSDKYFVYIDAEHEKGELKIGSWILPGKSKKKIVLAAHLDHPFQINDGLSGVITGLKLFEMLKKQELEHTYQLLILPETIGSLAWLSHNEMEIDNIVGGSFLEMTGTSIYPSVQKSYFGNTPFDCEMEYLFQLYDKHTKIYDYRQLPGNDERQFNAPGVRIPMLSFCRCEEPGSEHFPFQNYHTDADNLNSINFENIMSSAELLYKVFSMYEQNILYVNRFKGELFLSGLRYPKEIDSLDLVHVDCLRVIDMIDGTNSPIQIAQKLNLNLKEIVEFFKVLEFNGLVERCGVK